MTEIRTPEQDPRASFMALLETLADTAAGFTNDRFIRDVITPELQAKWQKYYWEVQRPELGTKDLQMPRGFRPIDLWYRGAETVIEHAEVAASRAAEKHKHLVVQGLAEYFGMDISGLFDDHWSTDFERENWFPNAQPESFRFALDKLKSLEPVGQQGGK